MKTGDKVRYIGTAQFHYQKAFGSRKRVLNPTGVVVSEVYTLTSAARTEFVDVAWDHETLDEKALLTDNLFHPVNVTNLEIMK